MAPLVAGVEIVYVIDIAVILQYYFKEVCVMGDMLLSFVAIKEKNESMNE